MNAKWLLLVGAVAAVAYVLPGTAAADTAIFGSTLQASHNVSVTNQSALQLSTAAPTPLVAPADGVISNWAVRSSDVGAMFVFAVIHHPVESSLSGVVAGRDISPPVPDATNSIRRYPAPEWIFVTKGDSIVLGVTGTVPALPFHSSGSVGDVYGTYPTEDVGNLGTPLGPPTLASGRELLLQATEHFCSVPSLLGLKRAIAQQELSDHECAYKYKTRKVRARRQRGRVLSQSISPGTDLVPAAVPVSAAVVKLVIGKKRKHH